MNQTLAPDFASVMPALVQSGLEKQTCTIQAPDGTVGPSGAPLNAYSNVPGLVGIQCMDAPISTAALQATEAKDLIEIQSKSFRHVLLDSYYPQLSPTTNWGDIGWRVLITNASGTVTTYDLIGAEADSQRIMTRLKLQLVKL